MSLRYLFHQDTFKKVDVFDATLYLCDSRSRLLFARCGTPVMKVSVLSLRQAFLCAPIKSNQDHHHVLKLASLFYLAYALLVASLR